MTAATAPITVALPRGDVRVSAVHEAPVAPWAALALAHGAGAGLDHPFLVGCAAALRAEGIATLRFAFPYAEAGRRMPGPAAHAIATWAAVMARLGETASGLPLVAAGKSYGGRMASMAAAEGVIDPAALVYLGYPLHPPGDPAKARTAHLPAIAQPQLFLAGTNDAFLQPLTQFEASVATCRDAEIAWIDGGGHSFEVKGRTRAPETIGAELAPVVAAWLRGRVIPSR